MAKKNDEAEIVEQGAEKEASEPIPAERIEPESDNEPPVLFIHLKPGHPTGVYHRCGLEFSASAPRGFTAQECEDIGITTMGVLGLDPWLTVVEVEG